MGEPPGSRQVLLTEMLEMLYRLAGDTCSNVVTMFKVGVAGVIDPSAVPISALVQLLKS